jgi:peptidoglycan/LPS O-acetylase OafA/YrhL
MRPWSAGLAHRSFADMAPHLLAHSFYMQNLTFGAFVGSVNPVAWSLEIEVQFYVLVPLLTFVWRMSRNGGDVLLPFFIVVLYLSAFRGRISSAVFSQPFITNIGLMCYSIYLFDLMTTYVKHLTAPLHFAENFWFYFILQSCFILPVVLLFCGFWTGNGRGNSGIRRKRCYSQEASNPNLEKLSILSFAHSSLISEVHRFSYSADA